MTGTRNLVTNRTAIGELAVDGLFGGVVAGAGMAAYLVLTGLLIGDEPAVMLSRFDTSGGLPLTGALMHLAVSGVYGIIFGAIWGVARRFRVPAWLAGPAYGLVLFAVAETLLLPGTASPLREIPAVHFALAHVIYGLALGVMAGRTTERSAAL